MTAKIFIVLVALAAMSTAVTIIRKAPAIEMPAESIQVVRATPEGMIDEMFDVKAKPYLAVYHGASWCSPCVQFSPTLVRFAKEHPEDEYQLIFVSTDSSQGEMEKYMKTSGMPFPGVMARAAGGIAKTPSRKGIPNMVIFETATGKMLSEAFDDGRYYGPSRPLDFLLKQISN